MFLTPSLSFDALSDDLLAEILLYSDFSSSFQFCHFVSKSLYRRVKSSSPKSTLRHIWRVMYDRQCFAPVDEYPGRRGKTSIDYLSEIRDRRQLLFQLLQIKKTKHNRCFNIPNRSFFFKPMIPSDFTLEALYSNGSNNIYLVYDPPPVIYECDSFVLTSSGTGAELLLLDPFDGSLSVICDISQHCVPSDEAVIKQAMIQATIATGSPDSLDLRGTKIGGPCFNESFVRNNSRQERTLPPSQELLSENDYLIFDIAPFFPELQRERSMTGPSSDEFEMSYMGIDSKPILDSKNRLLVGSMVGLGRSVTNVEESSIVCTELIFWTKTSKEKFDNKLICRFPWSFGNVDFDPFRKRLFASFQQGEEGPLNAHTIAVYPMIPWEGEDKNYFAAPHFNLKCRHPVATLIVDSMGEMLLVGTTRGTIEIWDTSSMSEFHKIYECSVAKRCRAAIENRVRGLKRSCGINRKIDEGIISGARSSPPNTHFESSSSHDVPIYLTVLTRQPDLPILQTPVDSICLPKHLSPNQAGFVTLQYHREEGSSLLLWRKDGALRRFEVVSLINLQLSCRRKPRVSFDGNRLLVFGEDHIGVVILIYQVSNADLHFSNEDDCSSREHNGGLYNLTTPPQVRFGNRIRHAALGGIDRLDTIQMTTNERYIIVNTKTGNLLGGSSSPFSEGLLVIDLKDQGRKPRVIISMFLCRPHVRD